MPYFPEPWMDELLSKTDIVSVVSDYVSLNPKGGRFWGCCPFHNEKTPSFSVQPEKQMYYCFGCHAGGGVIHFVMEAERMGFVEAVKLLAQRANMELPDEVNDDRLKAERAYKERLYAACKEAARFYNAQLLSNAGKAAQAYLQRRGVTGAVATRFGLGYALDTWDGLLLHLGKKGFTQKELVDAGLALRSKKGDGAYDAYRDRLVFPIISATGRVIGFGARTMKKGEEPKYINTGDTPIYNKRNNLYALNMQKGRRGGDLMLVEGYMDVISLHAAGIDNAVASLGTAMTAQQARLVKRYADRVYLCYDGDGPGQAATLRGLDVLSAAGVDPRVIVIPEDMDPDDYVRKKGKQAFLKLKDSAYTANGYRLWSLSGRFDLNTADGREGFAKEACAFVGGLQPVERERYMPFIARKTGLPLDSVKAQCGLAVTGAGNSIGKNRNTRNKIRQKSDSALDRAELTLLSCMLLSADAAVFVAESMARAELDFTSPGLKALSEALLLAYAEGDSPNLRLIVNELPGEQAEEAAAALELGPPEGDAKTIAEDCVKKLARERIRERIAVLGEAANGADPAERGPYLEKLRELNQKLLLFR